MPCAGLLEHHEGMAALLVPTVNPYKRLRPGELVGYWANWGYDHRVVFSYLRMPEEEMFVELYCDMQQLEVDHVPIRHRDTPHSSNTWGILPPRTYFRFDQEAVELEKKQDSAYNP